MDEINDSLGRRLRNAAVDRTHAQSERVDDFVLDDDGVIDLRDFAREPGEKSIAAPAAALAAIRGQLGDAAEVSNLYDESEPDGSIWRRALRPRRSGDDGPTHAPALEPDLTIPVPTPRLPPISRLSMVPLSTDREPAPAPLTEPTNTLLRNTLPTNPLPTNPTDVPPTPAPRPETDALDEGRPTSPCPRCDGVGQRDLFDRFSQVEFYSCDLCNHMWQQDRG